MQSCLYSGWVRHRRFRPAANSFRYSIFQLYLDLDELCEVFQGSWLWSNERFGLARFCRSDHFGDPHVPLRQCVLDEVEKQLGVRPQGPVRLLTNLRYFGYVINPVSYYFCFDSSGKRVEAVLAEVTNTPWGERHLYVLPAITDEGGRQRLLWCDKVFHVSPFMQMNHRYCWRIAQPGQELFIHIENQVRGVDTDSDDGAERVPGTDLFDVTLQMSRRELSPAVLRAFLLRQPLLTARIAVAIYWQALKLWWKGVPFVPHPEHVSSSNLTAEEHLSLSSSQHLEAARN